MSSSSPEPFPKFVGTHGPDADPRPVSEDVVAGYRGRLPDLLLDHWAGRGWGSYGRGLLWTVDPGEFADVLPPWLQDPTCDELVVARTAFGALLYWDGVEAVFLDVLLAEATPLIDEIDYVFDGFLCKTGFLDAMVNRDTFVAALPRLGPPGPDECYAFVPPLVLGGSLDPSTLQKVDLRTHLEILRGGS